MAITLDFFGFVEALGVEPSLGYEFTCIRPPEGPGCIEIGDWRADDCAFGHSELVSCRSVSSRKGTTEWDDVILRCLTRTLGVESVRKELDARLEWFHQPEGASEVFRAQ